MNGDKLDAKNLKGRIFGDIPNLETGTGKEALRLQSLTASLSDGDRHAWDEIYLAFYDSIKLHINQLVRSDEDAADLTQEVFVILWQNSAKIKTNLKGYLYAIARSVAYRFIRERANKRGNTRPLADYPFPDITDISPDDILVADEMRTLIALALEDMPPKRREVFEMSRYEGMSYDEIAKKLNISVSTVENHVYNVTRELKNILCVFIAVLLSDGMPI